MLDKLFNSGTRLKILNWFFKFPDQEFFIQELLRGLGTDARNVFTELNYLEKLEILTSRKQGRERFFRVNKSSKYFESLGSLFTVYQKDLNSNKETLDLLVDDYFATPQVLSAAASVNNVNETLKDFGLESKISTTLHCYQENRYRVWINKKEFRMLSKEITDKVVNDEVFITKLTHDFKQKQSVLLDFCKKLESQNLAKLADKELFETYKYYYQIYQDFSLLQWLFIEFDENNLVSNLLFEKLQEILKSNLNSNKNVEELETDLVFLTTDFASSKAKQESQSFLEILDYVENKPKILDYLASTETRFIRQDLSELDLEILKKIQLHTKNYGWLSYGQSGPGWDENYYLQVLAGVCRQIKKTGKSGISGRLKLKIKDEELKIKNSRTTLQSKYNLNMSQKEIFTRVQKIFDLGPECLDTFYLTFSIVENLYREIGKRFFLSLKQVRYLYPHEIEILFEKQGFDVEILNQRYINSSQYSSINLSLDKLLFGEQNDQLLQNFNLVKAEKRAFSLLRGIPISPGLVFGKVATNLEINPAKKQDSLVLVLQTENYEFQENTNIVAIILEDKNPSSDFTALCRFLGIVCVSGVENATKVLEVGQSVLVDSLHGEVVVS